MSTGHSRPETDERVETLLRTPDAASGDTVAVLVGVDESAENGGPALRELVDRVGGEVLKDHGFGVYKLSVPVTALDAFTDASYLEYVEIPDPDGSPVLMGN